MTESAPSNLVTATSGAAAPAPPVIAANPTVNGEVITLQITMPTVDVTGAALANPLTSISVFFAPTGTLAGNEGSITPMVTSGSFPPGSVQSIPVTVPDYNEAFDFEAECGQ